MLAQDMIRVADLWKLQELDTALDARRAALNDARDRLGESSELVAARSLVAERLQRLHEARAAQKDIELEADALKAKIGPVEKRLYDGSVRNPKELTDLQHDLDQLKRHLSAVEDRDLEALTALESAEAEDRAASAASESIEAAWTDEQGELADRLQRITTEIAGYEQRRGAHAPHIDAATLATYNHVRRIRQGRAVARLDRNLCTGCRISLPVNIVSKARAGNALVQCPNCERILYA